MKLYSNSIVVNRKIKIFLMEKALELEMPVMQDIRNFSPPPDYQFPISSHWGSINEAVLVDGDCIANGGLAICAHVERRYPSPALFPLEPRLLAFVNYVEERFYTSLAVTVEEISYHKAGESGSIVDRAEMRIEHHLKPMLAFLERAIGDTEFLVSNTITIADISIGVSTMQISRYFWRPSTLGYVFESLSSDYPRLTELCNRLWARESFSKARE
jgi:glutathione S-transferase